MELRSGFSWHGEGELWLGRIAMLSLTPRQFAVLYVLASHALTLAGKPTIHPVKGPPNLCAKDVLAEIQALNARHKLFGAAFGTNDPLSVTRVISDLRARFQAHGLPRDLIKTGPRRNGYRLSFDLRNLTIDLRD